MTIRNRIKAHRRVRAGDLVPHEWNFRTHPHLQRTALRQLDEQIGFARSLLASELPDGRLKLIDGHLRRDLAPDMEVDVEVLDVNEDEARALLLSIDPLAELAQTQEQLHDRLLELTPTDSLELQAVWQGAAEAALEENPRRGFTDCPEQWLVMITCRNEQNQVELLQRFQNEGLPARALIS
jgi:hypothetical protein